MTLKVLRTTSHPSESETEVAVIPLFRAPWRPVDEHPGDRWPRDGHHRWRVRDRRPRGARLTLSLGATKRPGLFGSLSLRRRNSLTRGRLPRAFHKHLRGSAPGLRISAVALTVNVPLRTYVLICPKEVVGVESLFECLKSQELGLTVCGAYARFPFVSEEVDVDALTPRPQV